jgi:hypothetical protein
MVNLDITIIIFSRERHNELLRSLRYWDEIGLAYVVVHNSINDLAYQSRNVNSVYVKSQSSFADRCKIANSYIKTRYSIICSDDEVYLLSALKKMIELLDRKEELESVGGQAIGIGIYGSSLTTTYAYTNMLAYANLSEDAEARLNYHFNTFNTYKQGSMYRMMRTKSMNTLLSIFSELSFVSTPYIFEITGEILMNYLGKSEYLNEVFWIRNWIKSPVSDSAWNRKRYFYIWFESDEFSLEVSKWIQIMNTYTNSINTNGVLEKFLPIIYENRKRVELNEEKKSKSKFQFLTLHQKNEIKKLLKLRPKPSSIMDVSQYLSIFKVSINEVEFNQAIKALFL